MRTTTCYDLNLTQQPRVELIARICCERKVHDVCVIIPLTMRGASDEMNECHAADTKGGVGN